MDLVIGVALMEYLLVPLLYYFLHNTIYFKHSEVNLLYVW